VAATTVISTPGGRWRSPSLDAKKEYFRVAIFVGGEQMEDLVIYIT
jgi:hypothetical protein